MLALNLGVKMSIIILHKKSYDLMPFSARDEESLLDLTHDELISFPGAYLERLGLTLYAAALELSITQEHVYIVL